MNDKCATIKRSEDVLIIDDEPAVIDVLKMYCESLGCFRNIITAADGAMATKKLRNQKFALILLDVNMPIKKGTVIIKELTDRASLNDIDAVCLISGNIDKVTLNLSLENGVKHFIVKPFTEEQFIAKAKKVLKITSPQIFTS